MADKKQDKAEDAAATVDPEAQDTDPTAGDGASEGESAAESTGEPPSGHVDTADAESGDTDLFETLVAERDALKDQLLRALEALNPLHHRASLRGGQIKVRDESLEVQLQQMCFNDELLQKNWYS